MRDAPDVIISEAARLHGVALLPGATRFIRCDRRTPLGNPLNPCLRHCGTALTDCYSCADKRLRAVTGAARLYALADPAEPREAAQQVGLPVCDTSAPCQDAAKRHAALHTLAWRLALGENLVLLCWCAPKACHLTAVADNITARAFFYAATLECLGVDGAPGVPALGPPALLIPDCDSVCADVLRQRQRSLEP